jgi:Putative Actinobacterial Holin-X, holin superfamily III
MLQDEFKKVETIAEQLRDYVNVKIAQTKLSVAEKTSKLVSVIIAAMIAGMVFFFAVLYAGMAAAYCIGDWLNSTWLGFLIVTGIYVLLGIIIWLSKEKLIRLPVMNAIILQLFNKEDNEEV